MEESSLLFTLKQKPRYPCAKIFEPTVHPLYRQIIFIYSVVVLLNFSMALFYLLPTLFVDRYFFLKLTFYMCDYNIGLEMLFLG